MSNKNELQQVLGYLVNEENEKAAKLLHKFIVERAAYLYETLVAEEDSDIEEELDSDIEESFGGDMKDEFVSEIEADKDDIESDELEDGEPADVEIDGEVDGEVSGDGEVDFELDDGEGDLDPEVGEGDLNDKIDDLSSQMADLMSEFQAYLDDESEDEFSVDADEVSAEPATDDELMSGMMYEREDYDDEQGDVPGEQDTGPDEYEEELEEATKLQDVVSDPGMEQEGKLAGTGKNSKVGKTDKDSMYTKAPSKPLAGSDPVDFTKGNAAEPPKVSKGKNQTPSDNIDAAHKQEGSNEIIDQQKKEGEYSGTGKNSKNGALNTKSPLSTAPKKP